MTAAAPDLPRTVQVRRALRVEIFGLLCAKAVLLGLLYFIFFGPAHQIHANAGAVSAHLVGEVLH